MAKKLYRRLPAGGRRTASALIHGETDAQRRVAASVREVQQRFRGAPAEGELMVGTLLRPYPAEVQTSFDAHAHLADLKDRVLTALAEANLEASPLPHQPRPLLVIGDDQWSTAWQVLAQAPELATLWLGGHGQPQRVSELKAAPTASRYTLFRRVVAPTGAVLADEFCAITVEKWTAITRPGVARDDGGEYEVGTLVRGGTEPNSFASVLSPQVRQALAEGDPASFLPTVAELLEPVDLVYTWVDGSDPAWLAKRAEWGGPGFTPDAQLASRFVSHDELRYSLRSVEMFAGWFNHLYLVTDDQVPEWLDRTHPRLTVVDHRELFSADEAPVFNSHAIESRLHRIPGLTEHFLYLNDDVFFGGPVTPSDFFTGAGQVKFFPSKATIDPGPRRDDDVSVTSAAKNNRALIEQTFGRTITTKLKHTPHAQLRSVLAEMEDRFGEVFEANVRARFRSPSDHSIVSGLSQRYGELTGRAIPGFIPYNYADISRPDFEPLLARWLRHREFSVFCLNDTGTALGERARQGFDDFLNAYFPVPSRFELTQDPSGQRPTPHAEQEG